MSSGIRRVTRVTLATSADNQAAHVGDRAGWSRSPPGWSDGGHPPAVACSLRSHSRIIDLEAERPGRSGESTAGSGWRSGAARCVCRASSGHGRPARARSRPCSRRRRRPEGRRARGRRERAVVLAEQRPDSRDACRRAQPMRRGLAEDSAAAGESSSSASRPRASCWPEAGTMDGGRMRGRR